ncbi:MAG: fibronectin type III domain-containing protein [Armatimonadetes bacterium]|nr:fibronectin type III domain-containing protein [Armatimonadota bacterium]
MGQKVIPTRIGEQASFFLNLATTAADNGSALDLTAAEITSLNIAANQFSASNDGVMAAYDSYRSAIQTRKSSFDTIAALVRGYNQEWQATNVPDYLLAKLGLPVHDSTPSFSTPTTPQSLSATALTTGEVKLKWKRNGNIAITQFVVETSSDAVTWSFATVCTSSKVTLTGYTPGTPAYFRVYAKRRTEVSAPSTTAVVYAGGGETSLQIAA